MNDLIIQLKKFATEDFPVSGVSDYLNDYSLSNEILNEYAHFKDQKYCRNLVHKENDFEIIVVCWKAGQVAPIHGHEGEKCWARVQDGNLQILEGLNADDRIVKEGLSRLSEGMLVRPIVK